MTGPELGFLLLGSALGDPERRPLTAAQIRTLTLRLQQTGRQDPDRELTQQDLLSLGFRRELAEHILLLLDQKEPGEYYAHMGEKAGCTLLTRGNDRYPLAIRQALGAESPCCLWAKGDESLLNTPAVALVGSRELYPENLDFAREAGIQAAKQGFTLVSGNARGADRAAQDGALSAGGGVISIVADDLVHKQPGKNLLFLSEDSFDLPFSAIRALSRNRLIHALGSRTFVAQCRLGVGGTWDGTVKNLSRHLSPVFCFDDGSEGMLQLIGMGATGIRTEDLADFSALAPEQNSFF